MGNASCFWSIKFFRIRIASKSLEDILRLVDDLENETKNIKMELARLVWYMRGGISLEEIYQVGPEDREIFSKLIKENLETAKKTGQPFW